MKMHKGWLFNGWKIRKLTRQWNRLWRSQAKGKWGGACSVIFLSSWKEWPSVGWKTSQWAPPTSESNNPICRVWYSWFSGQIVFIGHSIRFSLLQQNIKEQQGYVDSTVSIVSFLKCRHLTTSDKYRRTREICRQWELSVFLNIYISLFQQNIEQERYVDNENCQFS